MLSDTIAAIATAVGEGGIAVIRVSGPEAVAEVEALFRSKTPLSKAPSHTVHYGHIIDPHTQEKVEEVLVTVMRAPRSFTTEDVIEISTHGGVVAVKRVMDLLLLQNIRLAEPGEFTRRALLNGKLDILQAEATADLIAAGLMVPKTYRDPTSETFATFALASVGGALAAGAVGTADPSLLLYPLYFCAVNGAIAVLIAQRRARVAAV